MNYCKSCSGFTTLHDLLQQSYNAVSNDSKSKEPDFRCSILDFYVLKEDFAALRASAQGGCELCSLIVANPTLHFQYMLQDCEISQHDCNRLGPITIGTSSWWYALHGRSAPRIQVNAGRPDEAGEAVTICELEAFEKRGHLISDGEHVNILLRDVIPHSGNGACLSIAKEWLHCCSQEHVRCRQSVDRKKDFPTRLIDVGTGVIDPKLICPAAPGTTCAKWAALSYCWGGSSPFVLTKDTFDRLTKGVPLANFPNTLRDAVLVSRALDIPYIWIDALCIFQDSKEDWIREAPKMGGIYRNAEVVIAATLAPSSNFGIFHPRPQNGSCSIPWMKKAGSAASRYVPDSGCPIVYLRPETPFKEEPLEGRGWTFQETMLATRTLAFLYGQMTWTCLEHSEAEEGRIEMQDMVLDDGSVGLDYTKQILARGLDISPSEKILSKISKPNLYAMWDNVLLVYSMRSLTFATDRLLAISSLAAAFNIFLKDQYYAGIWSGDMIRGLLWSPIPPYPPQALKPSSPEEYTAPSWSWASLTVGQLRCVSNSPDFKAIGVVKEVHLKSQGSDPYGQVKSGWLRLEVPFTTLTSLHPSKASSHGASAFELFAGQVFEGTAGFAAYEFELQHRPEPSQHFAAVQMASTCYEETGRKRFQCVELLFLESAGPSRSPHASSKVTYRRVGSAAIRWSGETPTSPDARPGSHLIGSHEAKAWLELTQAPWPVVEVVIV